MQLSQDKIDGIAELLRSGMKIKAIKVYCDATGVSLQESKAFVEKVECDLKAARPETFSLPAATDDVKKHECVDNREQLQEALQQNQLGWTVVLFEPWAMGWTAKLKFRLRTFTLVNDRGYFELYEVIDGNEFAMPYIPHQENLTNRKTISLLIHQVSNSERNA